jgi:hypothetical protein
MTPERVASAGLTIAPLVFATVLFAVGLAVGSIAYITLSGGVLGLRGFGDAVRVQSALPPPSPGTMVEP